MSKEVLSVQATEAVEELNYLMLRAQNLARDFRSFTYEKQNALGRDLSPIAFQLDEGMSTVLTNCSAMYDEIIASCSRMKEGRNEK